MKLYEGIWRRFLYCMALDSSQTLLVSLWWLVVPKSLVTRCHRHRHRWYGRRWVRVDASFLAEISVRSPQKYLFSWSKKYISGSKYPKKKLLKNKHWWEYTGAMSKVVFFQAPVYNRKALSQKNRCRDILQTQNRPNTIREYDHDSQWATMWVTCPNTTMHRVMITAYLRAGTIDLVIVQIRT